MSKSPRKPKPLTKQQLLDLLRRAENALNQSPEHNPWDLGPSELLQDMRRALGMIPR
jgi:hypothetical protein